MIKIYKGFSQSKHHYSLSSVKREPQSIKEEKTGVEGERRRMEGPRSEPVVRDTLVETVDETRNN